MNENAVFSLPEKLYYRYILNDCWLFQKKYIFTITSTVIAADSSNAICNEK